MFGLIFLMAVLLTLQMAGYLTYKTDIFLSSFASFFLIGFKLVMQILEIDLLLQSILQLLIHSMFQWQSQDHKALSF